MRFVAVKFKHGGRIYHEVAATNWMINRFNCYMPLKELVPDME
jgi:hypothetical protein